MKIYFVVRVQSHITLPDFNGFLSTVGRIYEWSNDIFGNLIDRGEVKRSFGKRFR